MPKRNAARRPVLYYRLTVDGIDCRIVGGFRWTTAEAMARDLRSSLNDEELVPRAWLSKRTYRLALVRQGKGSTGYADPSPDLVLAECSGELRGMRAHIDAMMSRLLERPEAATAH